MSDADTNLIDDDDSICLCDAGQPDYLAATAVAPDGTTHLLLARVDALGDETVRYDRTCANVAHEQLGVLPDRYRLGLRCVPFRCGRPTKTTGRALPNRSHPTRRPMRPTQNALYHRNPVGTP